MNNNTPKCMQSLNRGRLRLPKLEIPRILRVMEFEWSAPGVGVYAIKGTKTLLMEDSYKVLTFPQDKKGFFGVYDGHGGSMAAEYVAEHLHSNITSMFENCSGDEAKEEAIKAGYLKTNNDFLKQVSNQEAINIVKRSCHIKKKGKATLDEKDNKVDNTSPWSKIRRVLKVKENCSYESPHKHLKENVDLGGLTAACKELANLAMMRGSFDDITVLIIDLYQFKG